MKECRKCGAVLAETEFYEGRRECKECTKKRVYQKKGVTYNHEKQRLMKGKAYYWNPQSISDLKRYYPDTKNDELTGMFGVSKRTLVRMARKLGIEKDKDFMLQCQKESSLFAAVKRREVNRNKNN
jgi:hypothetical protein